MLRPGLCSEQISRSTHLGCSVFPEDRVTMKSPEHPKTVRKLQRGFPVCLQHPNQGSLRLPAPTGHAHSRWLPPECVIWLESGQGVVILPPQWTGERISFEETQESILCHLGAIVWLFWGPRMPLQSLPVKNSKDQAAPQILVGN